MSPPKSLKAAICDGLDGEFRSRLTEYCGRWREHPTQYVLANVVRHFAEGDLASKLYETLSNENFRKLRQTRFGTNSLREDLRIGLDYFGRRELDLLRYMQVLFLEQGSESEDSVLAHQRHCEEFSNFLQLDVPIHIRRDTGVHRVLGRMFPMTLETKDEGDHPQVTRIQLVSYEIGHWRCSCGNSTGQTRRHSCLYDKVQVDRHLEETIAGCTGCGQMACKSVCENCRTRVTLDLLWQVQEGNVHPSAYRLPLVLELAAQFSDGSEKSISVVLLHLPLMLGLREKRDEIVIDPPGLFWIGDGFSMSQGQLTVLPDSIHYDRQSNLCKALEAALRRTLNPRGVRRSLSHKLKQLFEAKLSKTIDIDTVFTRGFEKRLSESIAGKARSGDLNNLVDLSRDCVVAVSPLIPEKAVWVNLNLIRPGSFVAPRLVHLSFVIRDTTNGPQSLSSEPPGRSKISNLSPDGIVRPGVVVQPGDILVGAESPKTNRELTHEQKLLLAIYGRAVEDFNDISLEYRESKAGRVLSVHVTLARRWKGPEIVSAPGKFVSTNIQLKSGVLAQIGITIAVDEPLEVGDHLYSDGASAVVCQISTGQSLVRSLSLINEPDLVVNPVHPWASSLALSSQIVRVGMKAGSLLRQEVFSRSTGAYSLIDEQPLASDRVDYAAQLLSAAELQWIRACGATFLAMELNGPRYDCVFWRESFYKSLSSGDKSLPTSHLKPLADWRTLADSPSIGVCNWELLLRSACIQTTISDGKIEFRPFDDEQILSASSGEVTTTGTINNKTRRAVKDGLFCEKIFGPEIDWECACGKYRGIKYQGMTCDRCDVQVSHSKVRGTRIGHIELNAPVVHCGYFRGERSLLSEEIGIGIETLEKLIYRQLSVVTESGTSPLPVGNAKNEEELRHALSQYGNSGLKFETGAEAIETLIRHSRLTVQPILRRLPLIPPKLRPHVLLENGTFVTSDLNVLYRRIIHRNNRLRKLKDINAPEVIISNEKRMLQQTVDSLLDNERNASPILEIFQRPLASLSQHLEWRAAKHGILLDRFYDRQVDYSACTRLVVDDVVLNIDSCLIPNQLALDLYAPLVVDQLKASGKADSFKSAKRIIARKDKEAYVALTVVVESRIVLVAPVSGSWPIFALHPRLTSDLALKVSPALLKVIGWENLGQRVRLFSALTNEATDEARTRLLPSQLSNRGIVVERHQRQLPLDVKQGNVINILARWAAEGRSFPVGPENHFILATADAFESSR